jgi:hypothetical protein
MSMPTKLAEFAFRFAQEVATEMVFEVEESDDDESDSSSQSQAESVVDLLNEDNNPFD